MGSIISCDKEHFVYGFDFSVIPLEYLECSLDSKPNWQAKRCVSSDHTGILESHHLLYKATVDNNTADRLTYFINTVCE